MKNFGFIHSYETFGTVDGPGIRFVIFLQGCPLRCCYCHNPDTWNISNSLIKETPLEVFKRIEKYKKFFGKNGGVTISGGEPLLQDKFICELFKLCRKNGIHTTLDTSGYIFNNKVKEVLSYTDLVLLDIKSINPEIYKKITCVELNNTLVFADFLEKNKIDFWVRHVVIPELTDNNKDLKDLAEYLSKFKYLKKVEILPYHNLGILKYEKLGIEYPLKGTENLSKERFDNANIILQSLK